MTLTFKIFIKITLTLDLVQIQFENGPMEGPTLISALIHATTMVAVRIFLVARLLLLFVVIPYIMNIIAFIGIIARLFGATLALAQKDI